MNRLSVGIEQVNHCRALADGARVLKAVKEGSILLSAEYLTGLSAVAAKDPSGKLIDMPTEEWNYFIRYTNNGKLQYLIKS
jgi:hypothetical protein